MMQNMQHNKRGTLLVLSGPSGAGKGTLRELAFRRLKQNQSEEGAIAYSISCTTRAPRPGEVNGREYRFISEEEFQRRIANGEFLEYAAVHGHHYGTLIADVRAVLDGGRDILLEIDVQGALQVKVKMPEAQLIFIAPPSLEILEQRLRARGTESEGDLAIRLQNARGELALQSKYDYTVINDSLETATDDLCHVIVQCRARRH